MLRLTILFAVAVGLVVDIHAQKPVQQHAEKLDSMLANYYYQSPYDTSCVVRPEGRLTLKVWLDQTGDAFHAKGTINDVHARANLETIHKTTVSLDVAYRGIGVSLAINPAKWDGSYKDYEFNLNYYLSSISLDFSYQHSQSLAGHIFLDDRSAQLESGDLTMRVVNMAGYYTFNHRRFSYPAAFSHSYIQRRSAGSWIAGFSYQGGSIGTNQALKDRDPDAPDARIEVGHFGIGGGYGYNWVLGKKWLIHLSMLPAIVLYNRNTLILNGEHRNAQRMRFNMIFNERAAIVYNFSPRYFAGATLVMSNSLFDDNAVVVNQNKWIVRACIGMRL